MDINPIKIRIIDIKNGKWKKTIVFINNVPDDISKELLSIEKKYNDNTKITDSKKLEKYYGSAWRKKLGIDNITGGGYYYDTLTEFKNTIKSLMGGNDVNYDELLEDLSQNIDNQIVISEEDIDDSKKINIDNLLKVDTKVEIEKTKNLHFIFDVNIYPDNNILDFKYKISLVTNIPIYRQHLYYKINGNNLCGWFGKNPCPSGSKLDIFKDKCYTCPPEYNYIGNEICAKCEVPSSALLPLVPYDINSLTCISQCPDGYLMMDNYNDHFSCVDAKWLMGVSQKAYDKLLSQLQINLKRLQNQLRFLKEIDNETILIFKREESDIINDLIEKKFSSDPKSDDSNDFNYLLNLSFRDVTLSKFNSLQKNINHYLEIFTNTTALLIIRMININMI